jgi:mono/diheme cytochrome c family protein
MPDERRSCVGCHEARRRISAPAVGPSPLALGKPAVRPRSPDWGTNGILEYEAVVQPVLDKHCVRCHSGDKRGGGLDLSGSRTTVFNMSYMELVDKGLVHFVPGTGHTHAQPTNDYDQQAPLSRGTLLSRLTPYIEDPQHSETAIPWEDRYRIYCWIDANVPFYGHYRQMSPTVLSDQARRELQGIYGRRCAACHDQRPRRDAVTWLSPMSVWVHTGPPPGQWGIAESGMRVRHFNLSYPEQSLALRAPLAAAAGGLEMCVHQDKRPVFGDRDDPDYKRALEALRGGVVHRDQPGVYELLRQTETVETGAE